MAKPIATQQEQVAWYDLIGRFRSTAQDFEQAFARLVKQKTIIARHPSLATEYNALLSTAQILKTKIVQTRDATDKVLGWLKGLFGFSGLGELGIVPLIPIAAVAVSVAAIGKWIKDAYVFSAKLEELQRLEARGVPPSQALRQVQSLTPASRVTLFGFNPRWLVLGGVALLVAPWVFNYFKKQSGRG